MYSGALVTILPTIQEHLPYIIQMEEANAEFVGQNNFREHRQYIRKLSKAHYSVFENTNGKLVGYFLLNDIDNAIESIELKRIVISDTGKGYGKETLGLIKEICFNELETVSIWLDVFEDNFRAIHVYQSAGFTNQPELAEYIRMGKNMRRLLIMKCISYELQRAV